MALNLTTIDYDQHVANYIAGLNATGHITHTRYQKHGVTWHHNGGRLSHQGVLNVWKYRPASAQFDSDAKGDIAQYANAYEYAWHAGNTRGNQISIGIEMCNLTLAPTWEVADVTWQSAARLSAWLYWSGIITPAPSPKTNMWCHHDWLPTACWGPYMDRIHSKMTSATMDYYATFKRGGHAPAPTPTKPAPKPSGLTVDGLLGASTIKRWQQVMGTPADGVISGGYSPFVAALQRWFNAHGFRDARGRKLVVDGLGLGSNSHGRYPRTGRTHTIEAMQAWTGTPVDGVLDLYSPAVKVVQRKLNAHK